MTHEISTITLIGSKSWDLLLEQIKLARKQGIAATDIYHLMDRLPGHIRKELHEHFRKEGESIVNPLFRKHINPMDALNEYFSSNPDAVANDGRNYPIVNRKFEEVAGSDSQAIDDDLDPEVRRDFTHKFNQAAGMDLFMKAFMPNSQVANSLSEPNNNADDADFLESLGDGSLSSERTRSATNRFDQLREGLSPKSNGG